MKYSCIVDTAAIKTSGIVITAVIGVHKNGKTNTDVEAVSLRFTDVRFFPCGMSEIFPNLKFLQVYNCGLEKI